MSLTIATVARMGLYDLLKTMSLPRLGYSPISDVMYSSQLIFLVSGGCKELLL